MVKKTNGVGKAAATSADAAAGPSKSNPSTPGSAKASKFKKRKLIKANREKSAVAAAAVDKAAPVAAGTGDGDASASAVLPQPSKVAEAASAVSPQPSKVAEAASAVSPQPSKVAEAASPVLPQPSNVAEAASPVLPQPSNVAEAASPVLPQASNVAEASPVVQTPKSTTSAEASPVAQTQKPATDAEGSVPAPMPATAEASASSPKPKPKPKPKAKAKAKAKPAHVNADAAAAISAGKGKGKDVAADNSGGDVKMKSRRVRTRRGKGKEVVEDGGSKEKAVGKKEERGDRKVAGFIFMCNAKTKKECYQNRLFGMPSGKIGMVKKIRPGVKLFLYDFDLKLLYGVYKAASHGGLNLVHEAFNGKFPAQVKFKIDKDCRPLPESSLKQAIKENYSARSKFDPELTERQVQRLLSLFKPISTPQSVQNNHIEERRHYEERRKPYHRFDEVRQPRFDEEMRPAVRHVPLEDPYRAPRFAPVPVDHHRYYQPALAPEPRQIPLVLEPRYVPLALDHHHGPAVPELRHVPASYYRTLAPSGDSYYRSVENLVPERYADRTVADVTTRDPIIRDHTALPGEASARADRLDDLYRTRGAHVEELYRSGEISAHSDRVGIRADRVEELYRSDRLVNRAVDPPHSAYLTTSYETNPAYAETSIRPLSARVSGPGAPVSSLYSLTGGPVYR